VPESVFSHVDGSGDPNELVRYLDATKGVQLFRELGRLLLAELRVGPGSSVVDVGCGPGTDALEIAAAVAPRGRVVGVDASSIMVAEARRRAAGRGLAVEFRVGSAERLDLPDAIADACRFERVLQHLADPAAALREAARVLRPGGQVAALEPDWTSLDVSGADPGVVRRVLDVRMAAIPCPDAGARLGRLLSEAGFEEVRSLELTLSGHHPDALRALRLDAYAGAAARVGAVTGAEAAALLSALDGGRAGVRATLHLAAGSRTARAAQRPDVATRRASSTRPVTPSLSNAVDR